jgi:branched-chain amino acid transport system ATP-binding protein
MSQMNDDTMLASEDLAVSYGEIRALNGIDIRIEKGEVVALIGPNGAGKSTLGDAVANLLEYRGSLRYKGQEVREQSSRELVEQGLIYCTEKRDLFDYFSVLENLKMGSYHHQDDVEAHLESVFDLFPRLEERQQQEAHTMSGGEQQMLAIGRALMGDPELLILDEPSHGLAPIIIDDINDAVKDIVDRGVSLLLLEQNVSVAMQHADRIYLLENGRVQREGTPEELRGDDYVGEAYLGK